jgi:hypothetical protein
MQNPIERGAPQPETAGAFEVQSRLHPEPVGNVQEPAESKDSSTASPGMQGLLSAGESHRPSHGRRMRDTPRGNPQGSPQTQRWRCWRILCEATRVAIRQWQPGERACGATRGLTVGNAGRVDALCGQPRTRQRLGGVAVRGDAGQPGDSHAAAPKDRVSRRLEALSPVQRNHAGREATRGLIGKLNGTMRDPSNLWFIAIEAPVTPVSGAFVFWLTSGRRPRRRCCASLDAKS